MIFTGTGWLSLWKTETTKTGPNDSSGVVGAHFRQVSESPPHPYLPTLPATRLGTGLSGVHKAQRPQPDDGRVSGPRYFFTNV